MDSNARRPQINLRYFYILIRALDIKVNFHVNINFINYSASTTIIFTNTRQALKHAIVIKIDIYIIIYFSKTCKQLLNVTNQFFKQHLKGL